MEAQARQLRFPWVAALAGATLVVVGGASLLQFPAPPDLRRSSDSDAGGPAMLILRVGDGEQDDRLKEELALQDPTPLFLPTSWSSGQVNPLVRQDPPAVFSPFEPGLFFTNDDPQIMLPAPAVAPGTPLEAVDLVERGPKLLELSRVPLELPPVPPRLAWLEVSRAGTGEVLFSMDVSGAGESSVAVLRQEFWAPVEVLIAVSPAGLVGRPAVVTTSGSERVDNWALEFLAGPAALGARLPPGFYRVLLGP